MLEGIIDPQKTSHFKIAQGHAVGRPGLLEIEIKENEAEPVICVGGRAVKTISGILKF